MQAAHASKFVVCPVQNHRPPRFNIANALPLLLDSGLQLADAVRVAAGGPRVARDDGGDAVAPRRTAVSSRSGHAVRRAGQPRGLRGWMCACIHTERPMPMRHALTSTPARLHGVALVAICICTDTAKAYEKTYAKYKEKSDACPAPGGPYCAGPGGDVNSPLIKFKLGDPPVMPPPKKEEPKKEAPKKE